MIWPFILSVCDQLICRDPAERLCASDADFDELKVHPFFSSIDWDKLYARALPAPFKPLAMVRAP